VVPDEQQARYRQAAGQEVGVAPTNDGYRRQATAELAEQRQRAWIGPSMVGVVDDRCQRAVVIERQQQLLAGNAGESLAEPGADRQLAPASFAA
jgi:hypothetical protein